MLALAAQGHTIKETAHILGIATRTASNHRERIEGKLGARSITHAVFLFYTQLHSDGE